jgi:hypothetical protein
MNCVMPDRSTIALRLGLTTQSLAAEQWHLPYIDRA